MDMNYPPLTEKELEQFRTSKPTVNYSDDNQNYFGVAEELVLGKESLTINFEWLIIGTKLLEKHVAIFPKPVIVSTAGDILAIQHAGQREVRITNLISYKFRALDDRNVIQKTSHH